MNLWGAEADKTAMSINIYSLLRTAYKYMLFENKSIPNSKNSFQNVEIQSKYNSSYQFANL
jgi:hypothetical protein